MSIDAVVRTPVSATCLRVAGFTPFTTIDFPERLAAVVFLSGCPWRCQYCHNPELIKKGTTDGLLWADILAYLRERQGWLDGVVFSGGEPTLNPHLPKMMADVRALGFAVGLHTGGMFPERLKTCLSQVDWIGLDIKALPHHYHRIVGRKRFLDGVWRSLELLVKAKIDFECRTTVIWSLMSPPELLALAELLAAKGVARYAIQMGRLNHCLDEKLQGSMNPLPEIWPETEARLRTLFPKLEIRY